jgi:glycosyltransferase 2 family protein
VRPEFFKTPAGRWLRVVITISITVACLWAALRGVSLERVQVVLERLSLPLFIVVGLGTVIVNAFKCIKLGILLKPVSRINFRTLFGAETVSILTDVLFPFRLLELVKGLVVGRSTGLPVALVMGAQLVEKAMEFAVLLTLSVAAAFLAPLPDWLEPARWVGLAILVVLGIFIIFFRRRLQGGERSDDSHSVLSVVRRLLAQLADGMRAASVSRRALGLVLILTIVEWSLFGFFVWLAGYALEIPLNLAAVVSFLVANALAFAFPASSAGSVGIYELVGVETLVLVTTVPRAEAFALALTMHVLLVVFGALSGVIGLQLVGLDLMQLRRVSTAEKGIRQ